MSLARVRTGIDSYVSDASPSGNAGTSKYIRVWGGSTVKRGFIYMKSPVPRGATVLSATLNLYGVGNWGASATVTLQRLAARWKESQINYSNQPGVTGATVSRTQTETVDATEWAFDVTALLQLIADGAPNYGFRISTTSGTQRNFYSLNASEHRPVLEVEWADSPDAPTELSPAGGSAVTIAKPVLSFNFHDVSGSTQMQACQVQINPTNTFTSPAFDSGTVLTNDPELDLSTTGYAGIALAATAYWRVRVQDAAGLWSDWSDPARFGRVARGTLTIGSPTGGVVSDFTPTVIWSLSGATQTAWRVIVVDDSDPTKPILDTGRRSGTATSFTLPKHVIGDESTTYRLTVRVWDEPTRVSTPGDLIHTEAVQTFVFVEDPTPNPPTSVTAAQVASGQPHVKLDIVIAVAPDSFSIQRGSKVIDSDVDPVDIYVSGTTYRFIDRTAEPHTSHTWKVRCKVSGAVGAARSSGSFGYEVSEVWLTDVDTGKLVPIQIGSDDQVSFDMPEISGVYQPVDGNAVVRVSQGHFGLQGHIEGFIDDYAGSTAANWVANLLWMKARPENTLRLTLGAQNLNAIVGNVVVEPLAGGNPDDRRVSLDFWTLDGVTQQ